MTDHTLRSQTGASSKTNIAGNVLLGQFALTIFVSAFLLFSVQPMFTKMVLPALGGTPAVWSIAMVFFQAVLLAGYGYAHLLTKFLTIKTAALVHLAVFASTFLFLPISMATGWGDPPETGQATWLLGLFAVSVGLPFFAVSANGPLLQAWFSKTGHAHAEDPYFLYGASNIGSFASLIGYVVLFEVFFPLETQSFMWSVGFMGLGALIAVCAAMTIMRSPALTNMSAEAGSAKASPSRDVASPTLRSRLKWIWLAFVPSGLLVATTAHLTIDVASVPLLWIVPLSLFLLTFVFAFARKPWFTVEGLERTLLFATAFVLASMALPGFLSLPVQIAIHVVHFFVAALLLHSILAEKRPAAEHLTEFYLWMSFGGVLGGIFASLAAPVAFNWLAEYPLLIAAAFLSSPRIWKDGKDKPLFAIVGGAAVTGFVWFVGNAASLTLLLLGMLLALTVLQTLRRLTPEMLALGFAVTMSVAFLPQGDNRLVFKERSFFGVLEARLTEDGEFIDMVHGNTVHGRMRVGDDNPPLPLTYYHSSGGIANALFAAQDLNAESPREIGVVGLGIGSLTCHRRPGERWTQYEIDRDVVSLARDTRFFNFMSACETAEDRMIVGDARLTLRKEADATFDYLLIDAFSSNSIPLHLITLEAVGEYLSKLKEDGVLVMHISNRHMDLAPYLAGISQKLGLEMRIGTFFPSEQHKLEGATASKVVAMTKSSKMVEQLDRNETWKTMAKSDYPVWTDTYSNILGALVKGIGN